MYMRDPTIEATHVVVVHKTEWDFGAFLLININK